MVELTASLAPPLRIVLGVPAGVLATLAMDLVMPRLAEGDTPPRVASGVLTARHPDEAPAGVASAAHYLAGMLTGPLYVVLLLFAEAVLGVSPPAYAAAAGLLYVLMVGFFAVVVLPRSALSAARTARTRRAWVIEAAVYLVVLVPLVWAGARIVAAL